MRFASKLPRFLCSSLLLTAFVGCSGAGEGEDEQDVGALEETANRFVFDTSSAKERAGEVDVRNAYSAAQLARHVYDRWADEAALRESLRALGLDLQEVFTFHAKDEGLLTNRAATGTDGYYVKTPAAGFLVFRGSENGKSSDAIADGRILDINAGPYANRSSSGEVHAGFYYSLHAVWDEVRPKLVERHAKATKLPLYIVGHSLGGALATMATHHLLYDACLNNMTRHIDVVGYCERDYVPVAAVYTFGSPRTGDEDFATDLSKRLKETGTKMFRFVNEGDQVSMVPRYSPSVAVVERYRHVGEGGDERALAILLHKDGRAEHRPRSICEGEPQMVQCDPALSDLVGGLVNGKPFWRGEHSMTIYFEKMKGLATGKAPDLEALRRELTERGEY